MNNEVHIKTYDEWLKYYENATKEQVIEDLTRDVQYFADAVKDIKDLQQELDKYKNIVDELEKDLINSIEENDLKGCSFEQTYITGKWTAYKKTLNKLKKLKGE